MRTWLNASVLKFLPSAFPLAISASRLREELRAEGHLGHHAAHAFDIDEGIFGPVLGRLAGFLYVYPSGDRGLLVAVLDVVYRDVAEFRAVFVEVVDHADRVLDQRGVVLHAVTSVDRQARIGQFRGEDRSLAVLGERLLGVRGDVKSLERLDPVFQAVGAVNRVVAGILALLKHQAADVFFTRFGRLQRHGRRGRGYLPSPPSVKVKSGSSGL